MIQNHKACKNPRGRVEVGGGAPNCFGKSVNDQVSMAANSAQPRAGAAAPAAGGHGSLSPGKPPLPPLALTLTLGGLLQHSAPPLTTPVSPRRPGLIANRVHIYRTVPPTKPLHPISFFRLESQQVQRAH